jgi:thiol-disulfide isomerase/thioredoxin
MLNLNVENFKQEIADKKIIVMFYRETGCGFCDKAKPIFKSYEGSEIGMYELGNTPDAINMEFPIERFPTFYAFDNGKVVNKLEGVPTHGQLDSMFEAKPIKIEEAPLAMLIADECNLIDKIAVIKAHLNNIQAEIKKRKKLAHAL